METNKFYGSHCISCGEIFADGDDIVVCPECGTPYHRECYLKEGSCINTLLHKSGHSWAPITEEESEAASASESGKVRCMRCGEENDPETLMCVKCGLPLHQNEPPERPFNDDYKTYQGRSVPQGSGDGQHGYSSAQGDAAPYGTVILDKNSEIDGITIEDYACYISSNPKYFIMNFFRFFKLKTKVSFNFCAVIFPEVYMLYRKMYRWGILMLLLTFAFSVPSYLYLGTQDFMGHTFIKSAAFIDNSTFNIIYRATDYGFWGLRLFCGFSANYLYYKDVRRNILRIKQENPDDIQARQIMSLTGGVSWPAVIVGFTAMFGLFTALMMIMNNVLA
ncbi:MAG: DUF2628 domain-containing protein [Ruminococcus sp.]|nr:DUF2628 domain-containing protein [Ruminococcus sp.]